MADARAQFRLRAAQLVEGPGELRRQLRDVVRAAIGQRSLAMPPHTLVGIELGSVGREVSQTGV